VVMLGMILCLGACVNGVSARLDPRHKTHNVTFFVHEAINTGDDANAFIVAGPGGNTSALQKGSIVVVDEGIFASADPNSKQLGKWQGMYSVDGGHKYRVAITVTIDQPGDLVECTYEVSTVHHHSIPSSSLDCLVIKNLQLVRSERYLT
jgi:hypothetical protein